MEGRYKMKKIIDLIGEELANGFVQAGYDASYGKVTISNRPDLCEYQCNGALAGAKAYKKAPFMIAEDVAEKIKDRPCFEEVSVVKPGFINLKLQKTYIANYLNQMKEDQDLGLEKVEDPRMILVDYGGPNVAKPLHVGHLRSAIIGESVKRIARKMGHKVLGDIHLGDWGYQMGLIITELMERKPARRNMKESIRRRRRSPLANWRKFTRQPARRLRRMRRTGRRLCMPHIFCRMDTADIQRYGIISYRSLSAILRKTMQTFMWNLISGRVSQMRRLISRIWWNV